MTSVWVADGGIHRGSCFSSLRPLPCCAGSASYQGAGAYPLHGWWGVTRLDRVVTPTVWDLPLSSLSSLNFSAVTAVTYGDPQQPAYLVYTSLGIHTLHNAALSEGPGTFQSSCFIAINCVIHSAAYDRLCFISNTFQPVLGRDRLAWNNKN